MRAAFETKSVCITIFAGPSDELDGIKSNSKTNKFIRWGENIKLAPVAQWIESVRLLTGRSWVRIPAGALMTSN